MKAIGGYFEMELHKGKHYHDNAIRLNTARNCFEYVLRASHYRKVYFPYYTCEVMLEPINKLGIDFEFYHINESLEPTTLPDLKANEAFLYTNYFGLKQSCVKRLADIYGNRLIVDNAQAFYAEPLPGIDTFYSARKFFGLCDGAYLVTEKRLEQDFEQDVSYERMSHLLKRIDVGAEFGFQDFKKNDDALCNQEIKRMSKLTDGILCSIDYEEIKQKRKENFAFLDKALTKSNQLHLQLDEESTPMVYPYWTNDTSLKHRLIEKKIYVATYWPNVREWTSFPMLEYELTNQMISVPIDQRYGIEEMQCILMIID